MSGYYEGCKRPICEGCKVLLADAPTPFGDGCEDLCWLCAHYVTQHGVMVGEALPDQVCGCPIHEIYPAPVFLERFESRTVAEKAAYYEAHPDAPGRLPFELGERFQPLPRTGRARVAAALLARSNGAGKHPH